MTTTVTPDSTQLQAESQEWPTLDRDPAHTHEELDVHPFDPTQGRKIGADPYDDPTQGRKIGADPYDDPTRLASHSRAAARRRGAKTTLP